MLRPRHRGWRFWLWMERLQHKGSCKHQIHASFLFLAYFKVFEVWSQGEDPQGHSKTHLGCIHTFSIPSQGVVWHIPRTAAPFAMALSKRPNPHLRAETGSLRQKRLVLMELHPTQHPSSTASSSILPPPGCRGASSCQTPSAGHFPSL